MQYSFTSNSQHAAATASKPHQSCPTLCDPIDSGPPGSPPWDSPGEHIGVGCHFLLQYMKVKSESEFCSVVSDSSRPDGLQPTRLLRSWDFPGKSTAVGCLAFSKAYTLRKPKLKKTYVSHCSFQHYLQYLEHGSNLAVHDR